MSVQTSTKESRKRIHELIVQRQGTIFTIAVGLAVGLVAIGIYWLGYQNGHKAPNISTNTKASDTTPAIVLPAAGSVQDISKDTITIQLVGGTTRSATIDSSTLVTGPKGRIAVTDIKKDSKVILFTKDEDGKAIATKITTQ